MIKNPKTFLKKHSGKIVGVGDIFDFFRSSVPNETHEEYLERTKEWWVHLSTFIVGNHDSSFLQRHKSTFNPIRVYKNGSVLALHGHQLKFAFDQAMVMKYELKWATQIPIPSVFWDIEEWCCRVFNQYFSLHGKKAYAQALTTIGDIDREGLLTEEVDIIITGHTHLPFDVDISYKHKKYRVVNCGSSLHGKKFKPIYIESIDRWFVSDLHLGTNKSILN